MNATLTVGAAIGSFGMILLPAPTIESAPVEIDWSLHAAAPVSQPGTSFPSAGNASMLLARGNTFGSVAAVSPANPKSEKERAMTKRIEHLRTLSDGWVGPGSLAPSADVLDWLAAHTRSLHYPQGASLIPHEDGSVALRWESGGLDLTAEVRPGLTLYTLVDNLDSDDIEENVEPLTDAALERFLIAHSDA